VGETRHPYRILVGKPLVKHPLARSIRIWEDNIKMDVGDSITPESRDLFGKPVSVGLVEKFYAFHGARSFKPCSEEPGNLF
jgi:hypothetical protein